MTNIASASRGATFLGKLGLSYPAVLPFKSLLNKRAFPACWMRIHGLPRAKRYAGTKGEWDILFHWQNALIDHLVAHGPNPHIISSVIGLDNPLFSSFAFHPFGTFQGADVAPTDDSHLLDFIWRRQALDVLLRMIAEETVRAFI